MEITPKRLYKIGVFCFAVAGLANFGDIVFYPEKYSLFSMIASIFVGVLFNLGMAGLFYYLLKNSPKMEEVQASDDIDEIIKEVQSGKSLTRVSRKKSNSRAKRQHQ